MKRDSLIHEFVEYVPKELKDGTIYVSMAYATAMHKCCCGCGNEVVTPLSPTDWELTFDGQSISLDPSIGNWSFPCQSHYWIKRGRVKWDRRWSKKEIEAGRAHDRSAKKEYFDETKRPTAIDKKPSAGRSGEGKSEESFWRKLKKRWF